MILKIVDVNNSTIGAVQVYENNENGELCVQDTYHIKDVTDNCDSVFGTNETELVDVKADTSTNKDSGYSHLNNNENEATISTEYEENNDNNEDFSDLKQQFNNSGIINNPLVVKKEPNKEIKYRKGNLYTFCYDKNGVPKIVIGPDCKLY